MRRWGVIIAVLAAAGCSALRDVFTRSPAAAARAAGQTLSVDRLADLASRVQGMPLDEANVSRIAQAYVDYLLFAMALARGDSLDDSTTVARAMWPALSQLRLRHYFEGLSRSIVPSAREVDSTYAAGDLRAFQHILITVPAGAAPTVVQRKHDEMDAVRRSLEAGGGVNFAAVARRRSEDPGSKAAGGYLDIGGRGRFVRPFEEAAWQLGPGQMSAVVRTSYGFHLIRRPPLAEIRDTFTAGVAGVMENRFDSSYLSNLVTQHDVRVAGDAAQTIRDILRDPSAAERGNKRLVTYRGGQFTVQDFMRWLVAIDPRYAAQLATANDSVVQLALDRLMERELALRQAESTHVQIPDSEWVAVRREYLGDLAILEGHLRVDSAEIRDTAPATQRAARLRKAVDDYFDRVFARQDEYQPVPGLLAQTLRDRSDWSIDAGGIRSASQRAAELRARADSARAPAPSATPGLRPAPGPPPVGAGADSARSARPRP
jgi:hypothetical protein